jgi:uncharacterized protein
MIDRLVLPKLRKLLGQFPAVALLGPRQVGKTTLAHTLADELGDQALYLDSELPSNRARLTDPQLYLAQHEEHLVILDEIHRLPGIFGPLRSLIDRRRRKGKRSCHFLLLGSASIDLLTAVSRNSGWTDRPRTTHSILCARSCRVRSRLA